MKFFLSMNSCPQFHKHLYTGNPCHSKLSYYGVTDMVAATVTTRATAEADSLAAEVTAAVAAVVPAAVITN